MNIIYKLLVVTVLLQPAIARNYKSKSAGQPTEIITVEPRDINYITKSKRESVVSRVLDLQWQDHLSGALTLLNALSSLLVVSEGNVININASGANATKKDLYQTIVKLIQETWETLAETEFSMMRCHHASRGLALYSKKIVETLKTRSVQNINTLLPTYAKAMDDSASNCLKYSINSSQKLKKTVMIGTNLDIQLSNEKSMNVKVMTNIQKDMNKLISKKKMYKTILKNLQNKMDIILEEVSQNRDKLIKEFNKINSKSAFERFGTKFVESLAGVFLPQDKIDAMIEREANNSTTLDDAETKVEMKLREKIFDCFVLIESQKIQKAVLRLIDSFNKNITLETKISTSQKDRKTIEFKNAIMLHFEVWSDFLTETDKNSALKPLYQKFLNSSTTLLETLGQKTEHKNETQNITQCISILLKSLRTLDTTVGVTYETENECIEANNVLLQSKSKNRVKEKNNELYILKEKMKQLEKSEKSLINSLERTLIFSNKMNNNLKELSLKNFTNITMHKVQNIVVLSIKYLSEINEGWIGTEKMASLVYNSIETMKNYSLQNFLEMIVFEPTFLLNSTIALNRLNFDLSIIADYSSYIEVISNSYINISRTYLLGPMSEISNLIGEKSEKEKRKCLLILQDECEAAQRKIKFIVENQRNVFLSRKEELKKQLNQINLLD